MIFTRDILHYRHQLSHQQIDDFLDENLCSNFPETKGASLTKLNHFLEITTLFQNNGIFFISLKGPVLSQRIYNDPTYRTIGDFDFLIKPHDLNDVMDILVSRGIVPQSWPSEKKSQERKLRNRNQVLMEHPYTGTLVELHWRLLGISPLPEAKVVKVVESNLAEIEFNGKTLVVLNAELELLFLVMHGGHHLWFRLKWLEDVHQVLVQGNFNADTFIHLARKFRAGKMINLCNQILQYIYPDSPILPSIVKETNFGVEFTKSRIHADIDRPFESVRELISFSSIIFHSYPGLYYKLRVFRFILYSIQEYQGDTPAYLSIFRFFIMPMKKLRKRYRLQGN